MQLVKSYFMGLGDLVGDLGDWLPWNALPFFLELIMVFLEMFGDFEWWVKEPDSIVLASLA